MGNKIICEECKEYYGWEISTWCGQIEFVCLGCGLCYSEKGIPAIDEGA